MSRMHQRTETITGTEATAALKRAKVAVFGIGGVGGYAAEALARAGIGTIDLIDRDRIEESNLNRQIIALRSTLGLDKAETMRSRIKDIDPEIEVNAFKIFYMPENADEFDIAGYDYIVDAMDTVTAKIELAVRAKDEGIPIISAMGTGNKKDASAFRIADISKTSVCPLARIMRRELGKRGIRHMKTVYSQEQPIKADPPGSMPNVPGAAGLIMAGEVIKDIIEGSVYNG
ncbi:MAG TPA: tRNA threonylcarbamoyladenosine dehydratase [Bacillota bacterium]|nr:tRNA threonylcarbamoyladenosine dehydratase [Bacillota bacterium]